MHTASRQTRMRRRLVPAVLAGVLSLGSIGTALAGADDGGNKAFFDTPTLGSASGMPTTSVPGTTNSAANAQPNASVARTGVAMDHAARPHIATRTGPVRVTAARQDPMQRRTVTAERRAPKHGTMHALHRAPGEGTHQS